MRPFTRQPIRRQVIAAACVFVLPIAAGIAWSANRTRVERLAEAQEQAGSLAVSAAASLDQYLSGLDALASALVLNQFVIEPEADETPRVLQAALRSQPLLLNVLRADPFGAQVLSALPGASALNPQMPLVRQVLTEGRAVVGELTIGRISGKPTIVIGYPIRNRQDAIVGVLGLAMDLLKLQQQFSRIPLPMDAVVTVLDSSNRILTRSREAEKYVGAKGVAFDRAQLPRTEVAVDTDGLERFYGEAEVTGAPWVLTVGVPRTVIVNRLWPLWRRNILIAAGTIGASLFLGVWLAGVMSRHLNQLRVATQRLAAGDLSPVATTPSPNLELEEFRQSFATMAANLKSAQEALSRQVQQERALNDELQLLQGQVVRQERLAAVGLLASGVAHELSNPLQALLGAAELLERREALSADSQTLVRFLKEQGGRAREIIRGLSRFTAQHPSRVSEIDLRDVVADVLKFVSTGDDSSALQIEVCIRATRLVAANLTELEQVMLNLVVNAQQAVKGFRVGDGRIEIRTLDAGESVRFEVSDNGPGVRPEDEPKLFQPFFTTKPVGHGTGLGLSVSYGIIRALGGTIGYQRNQYGGSTFYFELPAAVPSPQPLVPSP